MKYIKIKLLLVFLTITVSFYSCDIASQVDPSLSSIIFSSTSYETSEGKVTEFTAYVAPKDFDLYLSNVNIESSDKEILTVSVVKYKDGVITFSTTSKKPGVVTLTISAKGRTATAIVKVNALLVPSPVVKVKSINLMEKFLFLSLNEPFKLSTNVQPKNADDTTVTWSTRGSGIFVDSKGIVTARQTGNYLVIATSNFDNSIADTCKVYVLIKVSKITINNKKVILRKGEEKKLTAIVQPTNATLKDYSWKSSDEDIVMVKTDGLITGVNYGTATITATVFSNPSITDNAVVTVADLNINKKKLTLFKGKSETLTVKILPDNLSDKTVIWSSDNEKVATVDPDNGTINTLSKGVANIIATSVYSSLLFDTCKLTVNNSIDSIRVNKQTLTLQETKSEILTAKVYPSDLDDLTYTWSSDNNNIATVDASTGEVKALKTGKVNIIVTSNFGDKSQKDTCVLTVTIGNPSITLSNYILKLKKDQKFTITATLNIPGGTNNKVIWSSDASDIASVNQASGEISGLKVGNANIIATSEANPNIKDTCKVTVIIDATAIKIDKSSLNLDLNSLANLIVTIEPTDATEKDYTWSSQDPSIASINNVGLVTSYSKIGKTVLKATLNSDNTKFATCTVDVSILVKKITLNKNTLSLGTGGTSVLTYTLTPVNPTNPDVIWISNNPSLVGVSNGNLTAGNSAGEAKIYVISVSNPDVKDSCIVTVSTGTPIMSLSDYTLTLSKNDVKVITATITSNIPVDQSVTWTSSDPNIAYVTQSDGVIMAKNPGQVDITATSVKYPSLSRICKVTVVIPVNKVVIIEDTIKIFKSESTNIIATVLPTDATNTLLTWSSINPNIKVTNGLVSGLDVGEGYVYATANNGVKDSCYIKVSLKTTGVSLSESVLTLNKNDIKTITATVLAASPVDQSVTWSSSDPNIATVTSSGSIEAKNVGSVEIRATSVSFPSFYAICKVTVVNPVLSVTINEDTIRINKSAFYNLNAIVLPTDATNKSLTWSSINTNIRVTDGLVFGVDVGQGYVYATSINGKKDSCYVIVSVKVTSITLTPNLLTLDKNSKQNIIVNILPTDATDKSVIWYSYDNTIASVSQTGTVTANLGGSTLIKVTSVSDPTISSTCGITVVVPVTNVNIVEDTIRIFKSEYQNLVANVLPSDATNKQLTWDSKNPGISVSNGLVFGADVSSGYVYVYSNNNLKDSCYVIVSLKTSGITLSQNVLTLGKGENKTLTATIISSVPVDQSVTWTSSDPNIATVTSNGFVEAKSVGIVDIKATSVSFPALSVICKVTVNNPVKSVQIDNDTIRITKNQLFKLNVVVLPSDATDNTLTWNSKNPKIGVTDGLVSGIDVGEGYVVAITNNGIKDSCYVIVSVNVKSITLTPTVLTLNKNTKQNLLAEVLPADATDKSVIWSSDNNVIASVSQTGEVTAISGGTAIIKVTSKSNPSIFSTCTLTVVVPVTNFNIIEDTLRIDKDESKLLTTSILPTDATDKSLTWSSANNSNITVTNGNVTGVNISSGYVYAVTKNGLKDSCYVIVYPKLIGIYLSENVLKLNKGASKNLTVSVVASTPIDQTVIWASSDPSIATVTSDGLVEAKNAGVVDIKVTSIHFPTVTVICKVTVLIPVTSVVLDKDTVRVFKDYNNTLLTASIFPTDASDKSVTWISKSPSFNVVNGRIFGLSAGAGYVYAVANNGVNNNIKDSCYVIVSIQVTNMLLNKTVINIYLNAKETLYADIYPTDATDKSVIWSSDNSNIASVSSTGEVTGNAVGTAYIKATSVSNPSVFKLCEVNVILTVLSINLSADTIRMLKGDSRPLSVTILPVEAKNLPLTWTITNPSIKYENGQVSSSDVAFGYIHVYTNNGLKDSCYVMVSAVPSGMVISDNTLILNKGRSKTLSTIILASSDIDQSVTWTSSNPSIATVSSTGLVDAKNIGTSDIKATSVSYPGYFVTCKLNVISSETTVYLDKDTIRVNLNEYKWLFPTVYPTDAPDKTLTWKSTNPDIAINNGLVQGLNAGSGYIYVYTVSGVKDSCFVIVYINPTKITVTPNTLSLNVNEKRTLKVDFTPVNTTEKSISWITSNANIAVVSSDGTVTAKSVGHVEIYAYSVNSIIDVCSLNVTVGAVASVTLNQDTIIMLKNEIKNLIATVLPVDALDKTITWSSNNPKISVTNGNVTANEISAGIVYATASNGVKDSCFVFVNDVPSGEYFKFEASKNPGMQNDVVLTKYATFGYAGNFKYIAKVNLIPTFSFTSGYLVKVNNVVQVSGVTPQDFTSPVFYSVYASDNSLVGTYRVSLNFINDTLDVSYYHYLTCKSSYINSITTVILADSMNGRKVYAIGDNAFNGCINIISTLNLPNSLERIYDNAFKECTNMVGNLNLPKKLVTLGSYAFQNCKKLTGNLDISTTFVEDIGDYAFSGCSGFDGDLKLPFFLISVGNYSFAYCTNLKSLNFPTTRLTSIGDYAFYSCTSLASSFNFPNTLTKIGTYAFGICTKMTGSLTLPNSITSIGAGAFSYCSGLFGNLKISTSLTTIEEKTFNNCSQLTGRVDIPSSVKTIKASAFRYCSNISSVNFSFGLKEIGDYAFSDIYYLSGNLIIPNSVTSIGNYAFYNDTYLTGTLTLSSILNNIGEGAFGSCGFTGNLIIPDSVKTISQRAFYMCNGFNGNLMLPDSLKVVDDYAFAGCSNFNGNLNLPLKLNRIGVFSFDGCSKFSGSLSISSNVISIGDFAFQNCNGFNSISYSRRTLIGVNVFNGIDLSKISTTF